MSWRSWLLPHSPAAQAEKAIREAERRTDAVMRPITSLVVGIVSASWQCTQEVKPHLRINSEFTKAPHTPQEQDIYVFYEFLYFFMHLMNREAHRRLPIAKLEKLQQVIAPLILPSAVDSFFGHWPKKFKDGIERDLYKKLNDAEGEYASCKKFLPDTQAWLPGYIPHIDESALFSRVAMNVLNLAGYESKTADAETLVLAKVIETVAMAKMVEAPEKPDRTVISNFGCLKNFGELVERASAAIDVYESDGSSLPHVLQECRVEESREVEAILHITTPSS
jgi:hypothetical protein